MYPRMAADTVVIIAGVAITAVLTRHLDIGLRDNSISRRRLSTLNTNVWSDIWRNPELCMTDGGCWREDTVMQFCSFWRERAACTDCSVTKLTRVKTAAELHWLHAALVIWWIADGRRNTDRADKLGLSHCLGRSASSCHISDLTWKIMKAAEKSKMILANCQFLCVFKTGSSFLSTTWRRNTGFTKKTFVNACECSLNSTHLLHMKDFECLMTWDKDPNNILHVSTCALLVSALLFWNFLQVSRLGAGGWWTCLCQTSSPRVWVYKWQFISGQLQGLVSRSPAFYPVMMCYHYHYHY